MAIQVDIIEDYIDSGGWRNIRAQIDLGDCIYLSFPPGMTVEEMKAQARAYITNRIAVEQAFRSRNDKITSAIQLYSQGQLTNAQKIRLLDALCAEWKG